MNSGNRDGAETPNKDAPKPNDDLTRAGDAATRQVTEGPKPEDDAAEGNSKTQP